MTSNAIVNDKQKKSLKILFVVSGFPPHSGTAVLNQITGLLDRGHDVYIYAKKRGSLELSHPDMARYNLLERSYFNYALSKGKKRPKQLNNLPPDLDTFDIIYCQFGYRGVEFLPIKKKRKLKAKFVTCFRGSDASKHIKQDPHKYDRLFKKGDLFLPVCNAFRRILISLGCDPKKIVVHHSAIDCEKFSFRPRTLNQKKAIRIVTVCRLTEKKGLPHSIHAVTQLIQKYPNVRYDIVGFGNLEEELNQLIRDLGVQDQIRLVGRATEDGVAEILNEAHIFLLASVVAANGDTEGIPNAVKEAMARGIPVISTFHSGIPELVDSRFLVQERDVSALVKKMEYLIEHPELWLKIGLAGRQKIESGYDKEMINDRLVKIFNKLAGL